MEEAAVYPKDHHRYSSRLIKPRLSLLERVDYNYSMPSPLLATKLFTPRPRPIIVLRPRLIERLNACSAYKLTLISAPAGFGKTTLVGGWAAGCGRPVAWLSLDEGDNDPARFLTYFIAALQTVSANTGQNVLGMLQSPQPPSPEALLTALVNEINAITVDFVLILDDYHVIDAKPIDHALAFLLEHLPPQMHLVIASREDPNLPLARLRAGNQLGELRAADLCFTLSESTIFLNQAMGLNLSDEDISALETRTEGWIAGLQLAALALQGTISMQGHKDSASFIKSFTGSHHFVMDYLVEEVLNQQSDDVQTFLLQTSVLERLCGPLCDAVLSRNDDQQGVSSTPSQEILEYLAHANLFIVPLDDERRWYRYHHLFADLLRQRFQKSGAPPVAEIHMRASKWYEDNGMEIEAFHHAVAANDIDRAARLVEGKGMPLQFRGAVFPVLNWLKSLPKSILDARPTLWVMYASALSMSGQLGGVEEKLQAAESALQGAEQDAVTRNLIGHIAAIRALLAATQNQIETIISQSQRALEYLHPDNLSVRTATVWKLGIAYQFQGDREAAARAYGDAISISETSGNTVILLSALAGMGNIQESQIQFNQAAQTFQRVLRLAGDVPHPAACLAHIGLAHIYYEWNDLQAAERHGLSSIQQAQQMQYSITYAAPEVLLARVKLARGDAAGAAAGLTDALQLVRQHHIEQLIPEIVAAQVMTFLRQGNLAAARAAAGEYALPLGRARIHLAEGDAPAALALLEPLHRQMEAKDWMDELLKVVILEALALHAQGGIEKAMQALGEALSSAEPGGFVRTFVDEGLPMAQLLSAAGDRGMMPDYTGRLLAAFHAEKPKGSDERILPTGETLIAPLSQRELEVLRLIALGLSNQEICERLFLALSTVKGHTRIIFDKLQVQRRTEAVARARELGLLLTE